jgi:rubrerythrin
VFFLLKNISPSNIGTIFFIKKYITEQYWYDFWNKPLVNRVLSKFFKHISQKYKELRKEQKNEKIKYLVSEDFKYVDQDINQNEKPISMTQEKATFFKSNDSTAPIKDLDATSDSPKVNKKDMRSPMERQIVQNKKNRLKQIIIEQLQHYSQTGERLYTLEEAQAKSGYFAQAIRRNGKVVLEKIFTDPESASLIYSMILGGITTSYQKTKEDCIDNGLILITTPTQWFDMMKNRGDTPPSHLRVEVQCKKDHTSFVVINRIQGCLECSISRNLNKPLDLQEVLKLANERNIQAISFFDDSRQLTESEFNQLVKKYKAQHQDPNDYKSEKTVYLNLRWKCKECGHVFERVYENIKRSKTKHYCPSCVSSVDQQITLEKTEETFQGYITQNFESNVQLYKFLPDRNLLMGEYQVLSHGNIHVDAYGVISVNGKEFKIAIEHNGIQHYSLEAYTNLVRGRDIKRGIYKTDKEYEIMFNAQIARDRAKVKLFKDLNEKGYSLIVVPYKISPAKRKGFILQEFIKQTDVNPGQPSIVDYL